MNRALPRPGAVLRAQLAAIASPPRRGLAIGLGLVLLQVVALAAAGVVFGIAIQHERATGETTVRLAHLAQLSKDQPLDHGLAAFGFAAAAAAVWGLFWPFKVWRGERPSRRDHHWSMPVDRRTHDLARVAAGAVWLLAIAALPVLAAAAGAAVTGHAARLAALPAFVWAVPFTTALVLYLLASVAVVRSEHPAAWLWGTAGVLGVGWSVALDLGIAPLSGLIGGLAAGPWGLGTAVAGPLVSAVAGVGEADPGRWAAATALWLAVGAAGVAVAASTRSRNL
jgi:hypothetical protein